MATVVTKLRAPKLRPGLVSRPRLMDLLDGWEDRRVTLISASAGSGKTTLLAEWLSKVDDEASSVWVSLDGGDSDPAQFWTHVVEALQQIAPDLEDEVASGPVAASEVTTSILPAVINAFAVRDEPHLLVLDDLHLVESTDVLEAVEFLISNLPPSLHVAISTRTEPRLPLARWRTRGELTELRNDDLRMTLDESRRLFEASGITLEKSVLETLHERTEGWPAGLYLAALPLRDLSDPSQHARAFAGDDRDVADFLHEEVLASLPDSHRTFLLNTSICDTFCKELCDELIDDGFTVSLEEMEHQNLFLVPLDRQRKWYRYHHLFADLLRNRLLREDPARIPHLHRKAAAWFRDHSDATSAIRHLIRAEDYERAGAILLETVGDLAAAGRLATFMGLMAELPADVVEADPALLITSAWAIHSVGDYENLARALELLDSRHDLTNATQPATESVLASFNGLQALAQFRLEGDLEAAIELARKGPSGETDPTLGGWWFVRGTLAELLVLAGLAEQALEELSADFDAVVPREATAVSRSVVAAWLALAQCEVADEDSDQERLDTALRLAEEALTGPNTTGPESFVARLALARRDLFLGRNDEAVEHLDAALAARRYWQDPDLVARALARLAEAKHRQGAFDDARALAAEAQELVDDEPVAPSTRAVVDETRKRVRLFALRRGGERRMPVEALTDREQQLLLLLTGDLNQREIAREMYLSFNTIKGYRKSLYRKLGVASRSEAVQVARQLGLV